MEMVPFFFCQDAGGCRTGASLLIPREVPLPTAASCRLVYPCHQEHFFCFKGQKRGFFHLFSTGFLSCAIKWGLSCISKLWQHIPASTLPGCSPGGGRDGHCPCWGAVAWWLLRPPLLRHQAKKLQAKLFRLGSPCSMGALLHLLKIQSWFCCIRGTSWES